MARPMSYYGWSPYVPVAQRRERAARKIERLRRSGHEVAPVAIQGRKIATTFWGISWCENLEAYSDYANRLPRGRTYVRNGSVVDLQIADGQIRALVSGSDLYEVDLRVKPLSARKWKRIRSQCAGRVDSLVELLQGRISDAVMGIVTRAGEGLFPTPGEISLDCSCPDWATMCKHVAAVLYGVGARLDHEPAMLFALRGVEPAEMVGDAVGQAGKTPEVARGRVLAAEDLSSVFGVDIDQGVTGSARVPKPARRLRPGAGKKVSKKKAKRKAKRKTKRKTRRKAKRPAREKAKRPARAAEAKRAERPSKKKAGKDRTAARKKAGASRAGARASKKRSSKRKPPR